MAKQKTMSNNIQLKPISGVSACDKAFEYKGQLYTAREYDFWNNHYLKQNIIVFYHRKTGNRLLIVKNPDWEIAIEQFKEYLYKTDQNDIQATTKRRPCI